MHDIYVHRVDHPAPWVYRCCINHIIYGHFRTFLERHTLDALHLKHVILFVNVASFNNAVMSYMMSQYCMCIGHMTIYYKRATSASGGQFQLVRWFVRFDSVT